MILAIVGSRDFDRLDEVIAYVEKLPPDTKVISGGARGVDNIAVMVAHKRGLAVEVMYADWQGPAGKDAGFERNTRLVAAADKVVAFWDGKSTGTLDTIEKALKAGKPVEYHLGDGCTGEGHPVQGEMALSGDVG